MLSAPPVQAAPSSAACRRGGRAGGRDLAAQRTGQPGGQVALAPNPNSRCGSWEGAGQPERTVADDTGAQEGGGLEIADLMQGVRRKRAAPGNTAIAAVGMQTGERACGERFSAVLASPTPQVEPSQAVPRVAQPASPKRRNRFFRSSHHLVGGVRVARRDQFPFDGIEGRMADPEARTRTSAWSSAG